MTAHLFSSREIVPQVITVCTGTFTLTEATPDTSANLFKLL